jgi:predicted MFS family arabinose efflux permease
VLPADAHRNMRICVWLERLWPIFFGSSVIVKFYEDRHIDAGQVFVIQSVYSYCTVLFDVPTGHMAMRRGIRFMIIVGSVIQSTRAGVFVISTEFWQFLLVAVLTALGWSFVSGTTNAMMTEQLSQKEYENEFLPARADAQIFGSFIGVPLGAVMVWAGGTIVPFILQPLTFLAALALAYGLREQQRIQARGAHPAWHEIKTVMREMLLTSAHARWLVILGAVMFTAFMSFTWLVQPKLLNLGVTSELLVWLYTVQGTFGLLIGELRRRLAKRRAKLPEKPQRELQPYEAFAALILAVGFIGSLAGTSDGWLGIAAVLIAPVLLRSFADRLQNVLLNRILPNKEKRPVQLSVVSAANNLAFAVVGMVMGFTLDRHEANIALHLVSACTMWLGGIVLFIAYGTAKNKG